MLLLLACSDYTVQFGNDGDKSFLDGDTAVVPPVDTTAGDDPCDGADNDGDGEIDEGWPDSDGDGTADCADAECPEASVPAGGPLAPGGACSGTGALDTPVADPFAVRVEWQDSWTGGDPSITTPPLVAYLDDDDGDGIIGPGDGPEILVQGSNLSILDGATGAIKRTFRGSWNGAITPVVGDGDGDGVPEIFVCDMTTPKALEPDGTVLWTAAADFTLGTMPWIYLTDLEGDGSPELLVDSLVLDAATGALVTTLDAPTYYSWRAVSAADLDGDGTKEILLGNAVYHADGSLWWSTPGENIAGEWPLPIQADDDPEAEVAIVTSGLGIYDTDGTELSWTNLRSDGLPGAPTAADFDGDGLTEIGVPTYYQGGYSVYDVAGNELWNTSGPWRTVGAGSSAFDFAGDGSYEIVHPADEDLYVYDGATGAVVYTWTDHEDPTAAEYATIADVDEDGAAEIIVGSIIGLVNSRVTVLGHDGAGWPPGQHTWAAYDYTPGAIGEDNTVPPDPGPSWLCPGLWRAQPATPVLCGYGDLVVSIDDLCQADCQHGPGWLTVQVGNQGSTAIHDVRVDVYATVDGVEMAVANIDIGTVEAGTLHEGSVVTLTGRAIGATAFRAEVWSATEPDADCDTSNNTVSYDDACSDAP